MADLGLFTGLIALVIVGHLIARINSRDYIEAWKIIIKELKK